MAGYSTYTFHQLTFICFCNSLNALVTWRHVSRRFRQIVQLQSLIKPFIGLHLSLSHFDTQIEVKTHLL